MSSLFSLERLTDDFVFGEAPRWYDGKLWVSDIKGYAVKTVADDGFVQSVVQVPGMPAGLGWLPDGRLLVVSMTDCRLLRLDPEGLTEVADVSEHCGGYLNDMVVDVDGRAYIGNIGFDTTNRPVKLTRTNIVRVDPDGSVTRVAKDVLCPNGMAITPDGQCLLVGQSASTEMLAFDIAENGDLHNRRIYGVLPEGTTFDGMCLDAEGAVWVASPMSNEFLRMLEGGKITHRVSSGEQHAVACMLGGKDRRTLYCVTSRRGLHESKQLGDSQISVMRVDVPGVGLP